MDWTHLPQAGLRAVLASLGLTLLLALQPATASPTELADLPLANSSTANILPNIMMDIDNSGSMQWTYMPDYVRYQSGGGGWAYLCRGNDDDENLVVCEPGDPPFFASAFNGLYYNPAIRYMWPVQADGTRLPDRTSSHNTSYVSPWGAVPSDGYGIQRIEDSSDQAPSFEPCYPVAVGGDCTRLDSDATIDLVNGYPERVWCDGTSKKATCVSALDSSNVYRYPNSTYKYLKVKRGAPYYYNVSVEWCNKQASKSPNTNFGKAGTCQAKKTDTYQYVRYYNWSRVDIVSGTTFPAKAPTRTDCAGTICTYAEEMANFATWYAWYRTRTQMTKSSIGLAFKDVRGLPVDSDPNDFSFTHARVGFTTINNPAALKLNIQPFDSSQKGSFYTNLYAFNPNGGTPLRGSLKSLGEMYAGNTSVYADPVQYSCQKNFTIMATDGYWNDDNFKMADQDGDPDTVTKPSYDKLATADTLADVAYYYYHTDLRTNCSRTSADLCTDNVAPSGSNPDVDDVAKHQHMTTFTIGLGVDGTLDYDPNYKTSKSGDYFDIKQGVLNWPAPSANAPETIDDLWHAAVNGRGTYFSAQNPASLVSGLRTALRSIDSVTGAGAAAATSNLQPTSGDNGFFMATYRTVKWDGEVSAYTQDLETGVLSDAPVWQAGALLQQKIATSGDSDTRVIYTANGSNGSMTRTLFKSGTGGMTSAQLALFDARRLSQASGWTTSQTQAATADSLVNYLRGQDRNEDQDRDQTYGTYQRLYRDREKVLGDIVHAQPVYVKAPPYDYDDGYATFKANNAERAAMLYVASNDGMLHAFDATTGQESWAFVPPQVLPDLWRLADINYSNSHRYYLDGPVSVTDAKVGNTWKTVLIGALGKGGRGYYALDVTNPASPQMLWEFTAANNANVGYSYGTPFITKRSDGTWVAVVTSGYNNIPEGTKYATADGGGYVFVLSLVDGHVLSTIAAGSPSTTSPSGLSRLNLMTVDFSTNNTAVVAYGGDLNGVMWRFNLNTGTATKLADLGSGKPITSAPEVGEITYANTKYRGVFFGTGRYLGSGDLSSTAAQTLYGIKDTGSNTVDDPATQLVQQTVTTTGGSRSITSNVVPWNTKSGWYVNLPDSGERATAEPELFFGTLLFTTTVPSVSACQPGGYGWLYAIDFMTGGDLTKGLVEGGTGTGGSGTSVPRKLPAGVLLTHPPVGPPPPTRLDTPIIHVVTADGSKPPPQELPIGDDGSSQPKRVLWRELTN
ncbi:hypothetical protein GM658_19640 [Pseudoduganella eburnea]|uniref:PilY1 beta-propeller domain-containing protein n=1 Tax=Massilia eburnea TaxID=1776165 RepID=A0A6L6QL56_9BURK|nr:PilC/PilY family type IV pilus protein [Massilia eburnea]MTW12824.1 hypothetical protein [Massilia eburnea]